MLDPSQNGYGSTCVELFSVRELNVAASVAEELGCRIRPSVGAWACSHANQSTSWVLISADVAPFVLFIERVYSNDTWETCTKNSGNSESGTVLGGTLSLENG